MQTVTLTTKESEINVVLGGYACCKEPREAALGSVKYLFTDLTDIRQYYIRLGFHLDEFGRNGYYHDFGFLTLEDFCEKNFGLDKSAVSRCINVFRTFNASNYVMYGNGFKSQGAACDLAEKWNDYSYTQLCEMLPLTDEQREVISPDMTVKEIRAYKKNLKNRNASPTVASTQPDSVQPDFKPFNIKEYDNIINTNARKKLVRECSAVNDNVVFNVFDKDGKFLYGNVWCELIYSDENHYFFRLFQSDSKKE